MPFVVFPFCVAAHDFDSERVSLSGYVQRHCAVAARQSAGGPGVHDSQPECAGRGAAAGASIFAHYLAGHVDRSFRTSGSCAEPDLAFSQ